jgi:hypothetical protein
MRTTSLLAPLFFAATGLAQGVEEGIAPSDSAPSGCEINAIGNFTIGTLKVGHHSSKRESAVEVRQPQTPILILACSNTNKNNPQAADSALVCNLKDGVLRDRDGRTGSVVANHQFQFDGPPQAGAIYTGGFSICANGSLAIGGTTVWWQCNSGPFYNLYDEWIGAQCEQIRIQVTFPQQPSSSAGSSSASLAPSSSATGDVASVQSSLATISGAVSTVSKSAIGPSASFSSGASSATGGSATTTKASGSPGATAGAADAPPAGGAASAAFGVASGSMVAAFMVIFGAALVL